MEDRRASSEVGQYTHLGFFMSSIEDIELIRAEMMDRVETDWISRKFQRYMNDLESIWARRGFSLADGS